MSTTEDKHPLKVIASELVYAGKNLHDAIDGEDRNERTSLELAMMTLGSLAEEAGVGDDVARWVRNGVDNQRRRDNPGPNVQRVPVTTWCGNCGGSGDDPDDPEFFCPQCEGSGKVTK